MPYTNTEILYVKVDVSIKREIERLAELNAMTLTRTVDHLLRMALNRPLLDFKMQEEI